MPSTLPACSSLVWGHASSKLHAGMPSNWHFLKMWCPQQQQTHFTKRAPTDQKMQTGGWKQQAGPLKSHGQGRKVMVGGKNSEPIFPTFQKPLLPKKLAVAKVWPPHMSFFFRANDTGPLSPIAHAHGHTKGFGAIWAVWGTIILSTGRQMGPL